MLLLGLVGGRGWGDDEIDGVVVRDWGEREGVWGKGDVFLIKGGVDQVFCSEILGLAGGGGLNCV